jgi:hypothetical protein
MAPVSRSTAPGNSHCAPTHAATANAVAADSLVLGDEPNIVGRPAPVFQTQAKVARSLAVSETSTDGVMDPWWSYARLIRSD